jgi:hypothetical protein
MRPFTSVGSGRWAVVFLALPAALVLSGCGGTGGVSGKVSYKGVPLKGGNVSFLSSDGKGTVSTSINEDGSYSLPRVPTGAVTICVETQSLNPAGKIRAPRYSPPPGQKAPEGLMAVSNSAPPAKRYMWIPPQYADPTKSGLTYTVVGGSQIKDIELQ